MVREFTFGWKAFLCICIFVFSIVYFCIFVFSIVYYHHVSMSVRLRRVLGREVCLWIKGGAKLLSAYWLHTCWAGGKKFTWIQTSFRCSDEEAIHLVKRGCNLERMRYRVGHALWHPKAGGSVGEICGRLGKKRPQCWVTSAIACRLQSSRQPYISCSLASGTHSVACQTSLGHSTQTISIFCKVHTLIGTSPCVWYTWRAGVLYSNWNVLPRLTRASIMFLWRPSSDFLSAPQFRLLCPGSFYPAEWNLSNNIWSLIYWEGMWIQSFNKHLPNLVSGKYLKYVILFHASHIYVYIYISTQQIRFLN